MHKIFVLGSSGAGKTFSLRNLDSKRTAIINPDRKTLPLQNWRNKYKWIKKEDGKTDLDKSNYVELSKPSHVLMALKAFSKRDDIDTIVIDTITHMITHNYMNDTVGKDFKAYQELGLNAYKIFNFISDCPKNVIVFGHTEEVFNELGQKTIKMRSFGKMIDSIVPPSFFTTVLITEVKKEDDVIKHLFRTQSINEIDIAKSPAMVKDDGTIENALAFYIPNDITIVLDTLDKFEGITK